jgi:hypothetical protein
METMISLMQWLITGIGFTTVAVVVARSLSKEDSPLVSLLKPVQTVAIKVAGFAVVTYVILVTYYMSLGILSIQTIGMYVACCGILYSLFKDMSMQSSLLSDMQDVVVHKAAKLQSSLAAQAEEARKSKAPRDRGGA